MVDLETLGQTPGSLLFAIGAVRFDGPGCTDDPQEWDFFYRRIDPRSCERLGLKADIDTVLWWLKQGDAARAEVCRPGDPLEDVLRDYAAWLGDTNEVEIWGNGPSFDSSLLAAAYRAAGLPVPWKFWSERCYRTTKSLFPHIKAEEGKTAHKAINDAMAQAIHARRILAAVAALQSESRHHA
jgi:hypothetical protein